MNFQRPMAAVPRRILISLTVFLFMQVAAKAGMPRAAPTAEELPPAPSPTVLRIISMGETATVSRLAMLYLQSYDYNGSNSMPYRNLDYGRLIEWLRSILHIDPLSEYPLFAAARVYAEVPDPVRQRMILEFIFEEYLTDPNRRWPWATHAALIAKHRLKDLPLALKYAKAVDRLTTSDDVPLWAKQMSVFILEDMNELDAARIMLGGLLANGKIKDPAEKHFLEARLKKREAKRPPSRSAD